ncbi:Deoxyguanosinetriphosphate triphosphohydrolase-like protein, partial [Bienertia sinuspersici]
KKKNSFIWINLSRGSFKAYSNYCSTENKRFGFYSSDRDK